MPIIREHLDRWRIPDTAPIFANEVGAPLWRTLFRTRIWRPALVRAGLLGAVVGHERATTTLDLYTRRTDNSDRILLGSTSRCARRT